MITVTVCEEYPIYEVAEGGYYYTGISPVKWIICKRMKTARKYFKKLTREYGYIVKTTRRANFSLSQDLPLSDYIGEDKYIVMTRGNRPVSSGRKCYE